MKPFLHEDFLLATEPAQRLYHDWAENQPILDYHSHLPPNEIADDAKFTDLAVLWLGGDHYKWRLMRANGVPERLISGQTPGQETFRAWAATVPKLLGNPLYHWTHLELKRWFGIDETLDAQSADRIWLRCSDQLAEGRFTVGQMLKTMNVRAVCTTDDPADDLAAHRRHRGATVLAPTFRADKAVAVDSPVWPAYLERLGAAADLEIRSLADLKAALGRRHEAFHQAGCRLSDQALLVPPCRRMPDAALETTFTAYLRESRCPRRPGRLSKPICSPRSGV